MEDSRLSILIKNTTNITMKTVKKKQKSYIRPSLMVDGNAGEGRYYRSFLVVFFLSFQCWSTIHARNKCTSTFFQWKPSTSSVSFFFMETFVFICYCVFAKNHFNGWWAKFLFLLVSDFVSYECIGTEKNYIQFFND